MAKHPDNAARVDALRKRSDELDDRWITQISQRGEIARKFALASNAVAVTAEPRKGYDAQAAEWRAKLAEWQATTEPAKPNNHPPSQPTPDHT